MASKPAVVLLSGGVDSATAAAIAKQQGFDLHALTVDYGQRHRRELESAARVAAWLGARRHLVIDLDLRAIGGSALTDPAIEVPKGRQTQAMAASIPVTYVPARNTIFLALALALAETVDSEDIFFGANQLDYSGYPDCREAFIRAFEAAANLGTRAGVERGKRITVHTPLIAMTKAEIIKTGLRLGLDYGQTWSCYDPAPDRPCGACDSCRLRAKGFEEAGLVDPLLHR
ncbi:MAG TPA: 7-cyano-7-deazaguanine synthase QueC [candidate division Zixibacteria bacterium]|nr:7-cyano-7-deazaguanine synthase QueC [candidate division Zixibacteria bacterium]